MIRLGLALILFVLGSALAQAQNQTNSAIVGNTGAYNTTTPTCTAGSWCTMQTDVNGRLITSNVGPSAPSTAIATGTTGAVTATLAAVAAKTNYICGFNVSAIGGTAAVAPITVTGLLNGTMTFQGIISSATGVSFSQAFTPCVPASAVNTAIAVVTTADGTATAVDVQSWGYVQ